MDGVNRSWAPLAAALFGAAASAAIQEIIFRGVIYRIAEEVLGSWWAVLISALLFAIIHLTCPGATLLGAAASALQAGILLAAAYILTNRLWLPIGIHMAWDFANDGIFGTGISGATGQPIAGLLKGRLVGPALLTGGPSGIEASAVTLAVILLASGLLLWMAIRQGKIKPARRLHLRPVRAVE